MKCQVLDLGITNYSDCYSLQKEILNDIKSGKAPNRIIVTEHYPVFTIGRNGSKDNFLVSEEFLKSRGIAVIETDRGGDITYHGPGQIVIYPIIKIGTGTYFSKDLHKYLRYLEEVVIQLLQEYSIDSFRVEGKTGAWTKQGKIAAIGIGVSRWITYHGVALNVNCDLTPFNWINPCGFKDIKVTSMKEILAKNGDSPRGDSPHFSKEQIKQRLVDIFCNTKKLKYCSAITYSQHAFFAL